MFSPDNSDIVQISDIIHELIEMKDLLDKLHEKMKNNMRLLSISEGEGPHSILQILTELRVHSLNIVKNKYHNLKTQSGFDFEELRTHYVSSERSLKNEETVKLCLSTGGVK